MEMRYNEMLTVKFTYSVVGVSVPTLEGVPDPGFVRQGPETVDMGEEVKGPPPK